MEKKLTKLQAFNAMVKFLEIYFEQTHSDDAGSLLGDTQLLPGGGTWDPAAWRDWTRSVDTFLNETSKIHQEKLTMTQAFNAMRNFFEGYCKRTNSDDFRTLLSGMDFLSDGGTVEPAAWKNWTKCVNDIQNKNSESTAT